MSEYTQYILVLWKTNWNDFTDYNVPVYVNCISNGKLQTINYSDEVIFLLSYKRLKYLKFEERKQKHLSLALPYRQVLLQEHFCVI